MRLLGSAAMSSRRWVARKRPRRFALAACLAMLAVACDGTGPATQPAPRPNIVLFVSDDHGFADYGFMGSERVETPGLDRIAAQALVFERGYSMPVCAPSLATLLTGLYPQDHGIVANDLEGEVLAADRTALAERTLDNEPLLPQRLAEAGYRTFQIGKLWNTSHTEVGFTDGMAPERSRSGGAWGQWRGEMEPVNAFLADVARTGEPFFVWAAPYLPHRPHHPPARLLEARAGRDRDDVTRRYLAMVAWLDEVAGSFDAALEEHGLAGNTLFVYLSDNGFAPDPSQRSGQRLRSKGSGYELGIRTPILLRWPGVVAPRREREALASIVDVAPTVLAAAGLDAPAALPGVDLLDDAAIRARQAIFVPVFAPSIRDLAQPAAGLRARVGIVGRWKLLWPGPAASAERGDAIAPELYDVVADPDERVNLAAREPERVARMRGRIDAWWRPAER